MFGREDAHRAWILGECAQAAFLRLRVDTALRVDAAWRDAGALGAGAGRARRFFGAAVASCSTLSSLVLSFFSPACRSSTSWRSAPALCRFAR